MAELEIKLGLLRQALEDHKLGALRLRGVDWFAWASCGGSSVVILTAEAGVAEILVTNTAAWVLTDSIEAQRLEREELPAGLELWSHPWHNPAARRQFVAQHASGPIASDRPEADEQPLPAAVVAAKRRLLVPELARYRQLGADAAAAMTEVLTAARPDWTEHQLAGAGAEALWGRGIHPTLTMACGEYRLPLYRHPVPTSERLAGRAMLVFCARRYGLYANLTRFVYFRDPTAQEERYMADVAEVEAAAWDASAPGVRLDVIYEVLKRSYERLGYLGQIDAHHQGGTTGYLSREVVALPGSATLIEPATALAWNPSLPGAKLEDTIIVTAAGLEIITADPAWPTTLIAGRQRPRPYRG